MAKIVVLGSLAESLIKFRGHLMQKMVQEGHSVIACAPSATASVTSRLNSMNVEYRDVPMSRAGINPIHDIRTFINLLGLFREVRPDIVLSYTIKPVIYGTMAARYAGVRRTYSMITGLGYTFSEGSLKQRVVGRFARYLYKRSIRSNDKVFFQNPDDKACFEMHGLLKSEGQARLINGSGVDLDHFSPYPLPERPSFLLVARLLSDKGINEYYEAARKIRSRYPDVRFGIAGWIDENPTAIDQRTLQRWVDSGDIHYYGSVEDVRDVISQCSVYVLPSYREGTPRTVLEAMAMGRPIVTTDVPGCRETVINGENGFLVPARNVDALADSLERFITRPELVLSMGKRSREIAEKKFNVHDVNDAILRSMGLL